MRSNSYFIVAICLLMVVVHSQYAFAQKESADPEAIIYGSKTYDELREITYWGLVNFSVYDYVHKSGDAEYLKLSKKSVDVVESDITSEDLQKHFSKEFNKYFGDLPFNDLKKERYERLGQWLKENRSGDQIEEFEAMEEARYRALYGGKPGSIFCHVRVKRRNFPVLYGFYPISTDS